LTEVQGLKNESAPEPLGPGALPHSGRAFGCRVVRAPAAAGRPAGGAPVATAPIGARRAWSGT